MILTLLAFGPRLENHYQAAFAILSYLKDPLIERVVVVTDYPAFYAFFADRVDTLVIDEQTLTQWQGEFQFFWRVKIKALEAVYARYPLSDLLYVDSDTFLAGNLTALSSHFAQGGCVMHLAECRLADNTDKTLRKMHRTLHGKTIAGVEIGDDSLMWNAGVIGLCAQKAKSIIALSLQLCDEICATNCPRRLVEQFSFSLALAQLSLLRACDDVVGHYWGNKIEWNQAIMQFWVAAKLQNFSVQDCVVAVSEWDWSAIALHKKQRNTNAKLKRLIDKWFQPKNIRYFR